MERQTEEFVPQVMNQVSLQIENYIEELVHVTQSIFMDPIEGSINDAIEELQQVGNERGLPETLKLHDALHLLNFRSGKSLVSISYYTTNGEMYEVLHDGGIWIKRDIQQENWYNEMDLVSFSPTVIGTVRNVTMKSEPFVFSIVQPIRNNKDHTFNGAIKISGSLEALKRIVQNVNLGTDSQLYILDHFNDIVYSSNANDIGKNWSTKEIIEVESLDQMDGTTTLTWEEQQYLLSYDQSNSMGWKVISIIPSENFSSGIERVKSITMSFIIIGTISVIFISILITYSFTKPLLRLGDQIRRLDMENLQHDHIVDLDRHDEIGYLSKSFNRMVKRLKKLFDEVVKEKLLKQEAEILALQSQINPHFIYNSLESIRMSLSLGNVHDGEQGLVSLARILRYQAQQSKDAIPISSEREFIEKYLSLQKLRFGEKLDYTIDIDSALDSFCIPPMLIQPLIENSLKYGQSPYDYSVHISVQIKWMDHQIFVQIVDEGNGMSQERIETVLTNMKCGIDSSQRIGLSNIYQRLKLLYGNETDLMIESAEGAGTIVSFYYPIKDEGDVA